MKCHPEISVRAIKKFGRASTPVFAEDIASFYDKQLETLTSMVTIMVTIFWTLQIEFSIVMKQPWNLLFLNLFVPKRTEHLFVVTVVECIRKFQYYLVLMLVEVLYSTYLFTNQYLVTPKYFTDEAEESTVFASQKYELVSKESYASPKVSE